MLGQLNGIVDSAAPDRLLRGRHDSPHERAIGTRRCQREVPSLQGLLADRPRQLEMHGPALLRVRQVPGGRRQQRMRRAHTAAVGNENTGPDRIL